MPQMNKGGKFIFGQSIIQGQKTRRLRAGVYLFAIMEWVSAIGYRMFPLSDSGYAGAFQDVMHMVVTALVVLLSIVSLSVIVSAGLKDKSCRSYGICATVALGMMLVGAMGMKIVPAGKAQEGRHVQGLEKGHHGVGRVHPKGISLRAGSRFRVDHSRFHCARSNPAESPA